MESAKDKDQPVTAPPALSNVTPRRCLICKELEADIITQLLGEMCNDCRDKLQDRISRD